MYIFLKIFYFCGKIKECLLYELNRIYLMGWIAFIGRLFFLLAVFFIVEAGGKEVRIEPLAGAVPGGMEMQDVVSAGEFCLGKDGTLQRIPSIQRVRKLESPFIISFNECSLLHEELNEDAQILKNLFFTKRSFWCIYRL